MQFRLEPLEEGEHVLHFEADPEDPKPLMALQDALALAGSVDLGGGVWVHGTTNGHDTAMSELGYTTNRTLLQMQRRLPAAESSLSTVGINTEDPTQIAALVQVNNRAFSWHPEQSGMTVASAQETMAESWFRAEGVRLHYRDDELAGFCWTKIHSTRNQSARSM